MNQKIQYTPLYTGTYLLLLAAIAALQSVEADGARFIAKTFFWAVFCGVGFLCGKSYRKSEAKALKVISNIIIILGIFFAFPYMAYDLASSLIVVIIWLQMGRNFVLCRRREFYLAYVISLMLVLYAASISQGVTFLFYLVFYILAGMFVLMADYVDNKLSQAQGGDKDILNRKMSLPFRGLEIALITIMIATVIYLFIPRFPSPDVHVVPSDSNPLSGDVQWKLEALKELGRQRQKSGGQNQSEGNLGGARGGHSQDERQDGYAGFYNNFNVCRMKAVRIKNEIVFLLKADRSLYCRGKVFTTFDGETWKEDTIMSRMLFASGGLIFVGDEYRENGIKQKYLIMKNLPPLIFSAYRPNALIFNGNAVLTNADYALQPPFNLYKGMLYYLKSDIEVFDGRPSGGAEQCSRKKRYLQIPRKMSLQVSHLAHTISGWHQTDYDKAKAIETYLKTNYQYSLDTMDREWTDSPITEFLFRLKRGHCELFATSMVMLLRHAGVPARFVTGYTATRFSPFKGVFEVRELDAHAWVEAYIDGHGWVTFEPTPDFNLPGKETGVFYFSHFFDYADDYLQTIIRKNPNQWWAKMLENIRNLIKKIFSCIKEAFQYLKQMAHVFWDWLKDRGWWSILISIVFSILSVIFYSRFLPIYLKWRLRRLKDGDGQEFILTCYAETEKWFTALGAPRPSHFTVTEYHSFLKDRFGYLSEQIIVIVDLFQKVRYGLGRVSKNDAERAYCAYVMILDFKK
jgi:hypothetical protein